MQFDFVIYVDIGVDFDVGVDVDIGVHIGSDVDAEFERWEDGAEKNGTPFEGFEPARSMVYAGLNHNLVDYTAVQN